MWFERIKLFFERGLWTREMVMEAVQYGKITSEQYEMITGEPYPAE